MFGVAPMPTMIRSASRVVPSVSRTPPAVVGSVAAGRISAVGDAAAQVDAVGGVQVGEHLRHLGSEQAQQRQLALFEHGHLGAGRAGRGGGFQADPTGADDHYPGAGAERGFELVGKIGAVTEIGTQRAVERRSARGVRRAERQVVDVPQAGLLYGSARA